MELPISITMDLLMGHPMEHLMELLMDNLMDRSMDRTIDPMGTSINNPPYSSNYGFVAPHNQGTLHYNASMQPFMCQMGGGYYPTG